jgi:ACT domain-containing protein
MSRRFLTAEDVRKAGGTDLVVDVQTVVTPQAQEVARSLGIAIRTAEGDWREPEPDRGPDADDAVLHPHHIPEPEDENLESGVIVTCVGRNRPGVLGEVTGVIGQQGASIRDVSQKMVGDYFHIVLVVELAEGAQFNALKCGLEELDTHQDYVVRVMHERVFRYMHRV